MKVDLPEPFSRNFASIEPTDLSLEKSVDFHKTLEIIDFSKFIAAFKDGEGRELIVFETQPEISQQTKNDIRFKEQLFVVFTKDDQYIPSVFSLRMDFPLVAHLNALPFELPRCLCLYEEPYEELKSRWRGITFIERIREWLSLTAADELHQDDQPIEPFIVEIEARLILPEDYTPEKELYVYATNDFEKLITLTSYHMPQSRPGKFENDFVIIDFETKPQAGQIIRKAPTTLLDLEKMLNDIGGSFIETILKPRLETYLDQPEYHHHKLVVLIGIPRIGNDGESIVKTERIGFMLNRSVKEAIVDINLGAEYEGSIGKLIPEEPYSADLAESIIVAAVSVYSGFNSEKARIFNGLNIEEVDNKLTLIGSGALGSQVFMNLTRMGFSNWTIIDDDILMPHNLARHSLHSFNIGESKSVNLAFVANTLLNSKNAVGLQDNYLKPINEDALYENASGSVAIVDISASQAVARKLSDDEKVTGRRISIFLSPNGSDLVMIAEPADRNIRLNELEAQYYNMVYESDMFLAHFHNPKPQLRYSISCRDISGVMEQDNISALAGIASNAIRRILKETESFIGVWSLEENGSIKVVSQRGEQFESMEINGWTFQVSLGLIEKLKKERHDKLPNETGGVLLGMVDFERKTTYLTGSVKSPSDSDEFPTSYVRGTEGLESKLKLMDQLTNSGIVYIGEWHSHPDNCSLEPSQDDKKLFDWIKDNTSKIGYPPLMVIVGQERIEIYNNME